MKSTGIRYKKGYDAGYKMGYPTGRRQGMMEFFQYFQGTSIIVAASNQAESLRRCVESIMANTKEAHELIVIDQGSSDDTGQFLLSLRGKLKQKRFDQQISYAAAVNQGLRLARGEQLLILTPEFVAAEGWLTFLLEEYRSGENGAFPKPAGFRLMLDRETFMKLGYLDEAFGGLADADQDYVLRARQLGIGVHAVEEPDGDAEWKAGDTEGFIESLKGCRKKTDNLHDYYPSHVIVKGYGDLRYWIENGIRHPIADAEDLPAVRISQIELKGLKQGARLAKEELLHKLTTFSSIPSSYGIIAEGVLVKDSEGNVYQCLKGELRAFVGKHTQESWGMSKRPVYSISDDIMKQYVSGIPVVAPSEVRSSNL